MELGMEIFYTTPGQVNEMTCLVCGSNCDVRRDVYGPANFTMAIARISDLYDVFSCPHARQEWHKTALKLVKAINESPGKRVADMMRLDLEDLIRENLS